MTQQTSGCRKPIGLAGQSAAITQLRGQIFRVARFSSSVLIIGPSGTGKELVAREIHAQGPRAERPFIPVDCASMSGELMASQLFGHVAGAFTGANCDALGCFRAADGGTLFLDEIGELEFSLQSRLLRVLQERVVVPVGSHRGQLVNVRIIAATNRNLQTEVQAGRFRDDLFHRLHVVCLRTTALRDRPGDIPLLAETILQELAADGLPRCELSPAACQILSTFAWPGNVRQLRNVLEQAAIDSESPVLSAELVQSIVAMSFEGSPPPITQPSSAAEPSMLVQSSSQEPLTSATNPWLTLDSLERDHIRRTLEHTFYNRSAAARLLGVSRQSLLRKMKLHDLDVGDTRCE